VATCLFISPWPGTVELLMESDPSCINESLCKAAESLWDKAFH